MGLFNRFKHSNEQKIKRPDAHTTQDEQIKKDVAAIVKSAFKILIA